MVTARRHTASASTSVPPWVALAISPKRRWQGMVGAVRVTLLVPKGAMRKGGDEGDRARD
jgi:hypothetical protein